MVVLNLPLSFFSYPEASLPTIVTSRTLSLLTSLVNSVKVISRTRSLEVLRTIAQISSAKTAITTQKMMFLIAVFTSIPPPDFFLCLPGSSRLLLFG